MKYPVTQGLVHDFGETRENHLISLQCPCQPKVISGKIYGYTGYELFLFNNEELVCVHE